MKYLTLAALGAGMPVAFAGATPPAAATATKAAPVIFAPRKDVPLPERKSSRGSKSVFDFSVLTEVGMSFGVKDRTAASLSSIVSSANRKHLAPKKDASGNTVFKTNVLKDANGNATEVPTSEPVMEATQHFYAVDVDAKKDPDGASARIVRDK